MSSYWFISVPANGDATITFNELKKTSAVPDIHLLEIPEFKVGSLDTMLQSAEELQKLDTIYESYNIKLVENILKLSNIPKESYSEYFYVDECNITQYISKFQWDSAVYQTDGLVPDIIAKIDKEVNSIQTTLKNKLSNYAQLKSAISSENRKKVGNLSVKSLNGIVSPEHCVQGSEFFKTIFVAVPNNLEKYWINSYETMSQMVIPRSSKKIISDNEYSLFSAVLFNRVIGDFKTAAKEKKFIVRDYTFSEQADENEEELKAKIEEEQEALIQLIELLHSSFSDLFKVWMHIKVLRIFVESVLRYGLPSDFVSCILKVVAKDQSQVKNDLTKAYSYLDNSGRIFSNSNKHNKPQSDKRTNSENPDLFDMNEFHSVLDEYIPFVIFEFKWLFD
ncbi:hypothetical protein BB561_001420 [Smittium simulii]|uniref:V-type proton ATPase subunit C n=1 Tax=Smittium simulii TaxID=133385 RepID=A0A2T9YUL8_9FUNG|nr:hypothetical protein BB561_001420 [Smittium simulii]